jgi:SAM-dependent methyltransferase
MSVQGINDRAGAREDLLSLTLKRRAYLSAWKLALRGMDRECPCCLTRVRRFAPYGRGRRPNAQCPGCGSLERHRALWLFLREHTDFFARRTRVLAVAPEEFLQSRAVGLPWDYLSIDVAAGKAMRQMDLTALDLPDMDRDLVIAYHVLEHIVDDRTAISEIARVLRPGGMAILAVPLGGELTDERFLEASADVRTAAYGQSDHVRLYGRQDFPDRLRQSGLETRHIRVGDVFGGHVARFGLIADEVFFVARRASAEPFPVVGS